MTPPLVSIVMPTFNQAQFIDEAIASIVAQTFQDWELIVVDDCSTDGTFQHVASKWRLADWRIRLLQTEANGGTGAALNLGFNHARGKYETWFASDNWLRPTAFEEMVAVLDAMPDVDYVYGDCEISQMDATGLREVMRMRLGDVVNPEWSLARFIECYNICIAWFWRRELRIKAGELFQREPCEDYDMALRMCESGGRFHFIPRVLARYRRHPFNVTTKIIAEAQGDPDARTHFVQDKAWARARAFWRDAIYAKTKEDLQ